MRNLNYLNRYRVPHPLFGTLGDAFNGMFVLNVLGKDIKVIASKEKEWEHVSISCEDETPSWDITQRVKEMMFEDEEVVMQLHPKKSQYKNLHEHCLHLWRPINKKIPTPPRDFV